MYIHTLTHTEHILDVRTYSNRGAAWYVYTLTHTQTHAHQPREPAMRTVEGQQLRMLEAPQEEMGIARAGVCVRERECVCV
jgi:hypothetical protein